MQWIFQAVVGAINDMDANHDGHISQEEMRIWVFSHPFSLLSHAPSQWCACWQTAKQKATKRAEAAVLENDSHEESESEEVTVLPVI